MSTYMVYVIHKDSSRDERVPLCRVQYDVDVSSNDFFLTNDNYILQILNVEPETANMVGAIDVLGHRRSNQETIALLFYSRGHHDQMQGNIRCDITPTLSAGRKLLTSWGSKFCITNVFVEEHNQVSVVLKDGIVPSNRWGATNAVRSL